jgi:hypothetical protein
MYVIGTARKLSHEPGSLCSLERGDFVSLSRDKDRFESSSSLTLESCIEEAMFVTAVVVYRCHVNAK